MRTAFFVILLLVSGPAYAVPGAMNYQGRLLDNAGSPISSSITAITFKLYTVATLGAPFWTETWNGGTSFVNIQNGLFNVELGSYVPLSPASFVTDSVWLGISVGSDPEMSPRQHLVTAPYAMRAGMMESPQSLTEASTVSTLNLYNSAGGLALNAYAASGVGIFGKSGSAASGSAGVHGENLTAANIGSGVEGLNTSGNGIGVFGNNNNLGAGNSIGVYGRTQGSQGMGVRAENVGSGNSGVGLFANDTSATGFGAFITNSGGGVALLVSGTGGASLSAYNGGIGFAISATATSGGSAGVYGVNSSLSGYGVWAANSGSGTALYAQSTGGTAITAQGSTALDAVGAVYGHNDIWVDNNNANNGSTFNSLKFGNTGSEAVASKRTAGGNQNGIDFYTGNVARMSITSAGNVGVGTASPASTLHVNGSIELRYRAIVSGSTTLTNSDAIVLADSSLGNCDVFLPPPAGIAGRVITLKRLGPNPVYLHPSTSEQIDNGGAGLVYTLPASFAAVTVACDGTNWWVIGKY